MAQGHSVVVLNDTIFKQDVIKRVKVAHKVPFTIRASYKEAPAFVKDAQDVWEEIDYIVVDMTA